MTPGNHASLVGLGAMVTADAWGSGLAGQHRVRAVALSCALLSALSQPGCGDGGQAPDAAVQGPLHISAKPESVAIKPGQSQQIVFKLLTEKNLAVPDRVMQVAIVDDPATKENEARGATLSFDRSITNTDGEVVLQVIAGLPTTFRVRASSQRASDADVAVFVTSATSGPAEIVPLLLNTDDAVTTIRLFFYDGGTCAELSGDTPPKTIRPVRTLAPTETAVFSSVSSVDGHAVLGLAVDGVGATRLRGCVEFPGASLLAQDTVRIPLPLRRPLVTVEGRYRVTSLFEFRDPVRPGAAVASAWKDLSNCPLDPARLWLDCTWDAFATDQTADLLDCRPGTDEGPVGNKLGARRGTVTMAATDTTTKCRGALDARQTRSLDAMVAALFPATRPPALAALAELGREASDLVSTLRLDSTLALTTTAADDRLQADHRLSNALFVIGGKTAAVDLLDLGVPFPLARFIPVAYLRDQLDFATHGFTLRLGGACRAAFATASLTPRALPTDPEAFVAGLFKLATFSEKGVPYTGCAALDAALYADLGEPKGSLIPACTAGLAALARSLDAGFRAMDGDELDLVVGGTVPVVDRNGDHKADALGSLVGGGATPGLWSGEIRARAGNTPVSGRWTAVRLLP